MQQISQISNLSGAIVTEIMTVDEIRRTEAGTFKAASLPGHLIHIVTEGKVEQKSGEIIERFSSGDSVWYWENEPIQGTVIEAPWRFYTVSFSAPFLTPPPLNERVKPVSSKTVKQMRQLLEIWRGREMPRMLRHIRLHIILLDIIYDLLSTEAREHSAETTAGLWWRLESILRTDLSQPVNPKRLCELGNCGERTIYRACKAATGLSPMKRIKNLRLNSARGLVQYSQYSISEIAYNVGYERVQEFSRDYRKHFHCTPSSDRKHKANINSRSTPAQYIAGERYLHTD